MNPSRIRVKMCGMTRPEDVAHAAALGVDAVGLIFYSKSARCITLGQAKNLLKNLPPFVDAVAVLVNPEPDLVRQIIEVLPIHLLQFHGDESAAFCQQFNKPYIKAIHPVSEIQIQQAAKDYASASALLLDTPCATARGGTGIAFNWRIIPESLAKPYILAGGLDESNAVDALKIGKPYALDLCSGIEATPGIKDHEKMNRFMQRVNGGV